MSDEFDAEAPTQPEPPKTMAELVAEWAARTETIAIAEKPTRPIRLPTRRA